jgi:hypothetical protein
MTGSGGQYNTATDAVETKPQFLSTQPGASSNAAEQRAVEAILEVKEEKREERHAEENGKKEKKDKKKRKSEAAGDVSMDVDGDASMVVGETKEERRARKEAKKAVSLPSLHLYVYLLTTRLKLLRRAMLQIHQKKSPRSDQHPSWMVLLKGHLWQMVRRRKRRRRESPRLRAVFFSGWGLGVVCEQ